MKSRILARDTPAQCSQRETLVETLTFYAHETSFTHACPITGNTKYTMWEATVWLGCAWFWFNVFCFIYCDRLIFNAEDKR